MFGEVLGGFMLGFGFVRVFLLRLLGGDNIRVLELTLLFLWGVDG